MFERWTEQALRAIFYSRIEAILQRERLISPAHLLAGLDWDEASTADQLYSLKEHAVTLRALTGIPHHPATGTPYLQGNEVGLDAESKKALAYAAWEANSDWEYAVDTDHLVRAILRFPNVASAALNSLPLNLEDARAKSRNRRTQTPLQATIVRKLKFFIKIRVRPLARSLVLVALGLVIAMVVGQVLLVAMRYFFPHSMIH